MDMNLVIQERRRLLGLTQEQVANHLGVTTSAVNKWEKGSTYPDIALLPPLARLLGVDLNTLFGFRKDISPQDLTLLCREIQAIVCTEGFDAGFALAQDKLREYPDSDKLLHTLAIQMQILLATAGEDAGQLEAHMLEIEEWYRRLSESSDAVIRNSACYMLASRAIGDGQYERAQEYLDRIPDRREIPDKRMLQAEIYLQKHQPDAAAELMEAALLSTTGDIQTILFKLMDANLAAGDGETAACIADRSARLAKLLGLSSYSQAVTPFLLSMAEGDDQRMVELLGELVHSLSAPWRLHDSPLYRRIPAGDGTPYAKRLAGALLKELRSSPRFSALRASDSFLALLSELEEAQ